MGKFIDLTGQKFGKLTVIKRDTDKSKINETNKTLWLCECECGNEVTVTRTNLMTGNTKSCGCYNIEQLQSRGKYADLYQK